MAETSRARARRVTTIDYFYNDPMTPDIKGKVSLPTGKVVPGITVRGYNGQVGGVGTNAWRCDSVYISLANAIAAFRSWGNPIKRWAAANVLTVNPKAGIDLNAFYDRKSLQFFYQRDDIMGKVVFAADSPDVVCHELGHALLDAIAPRLWFLSDAEVWAFHEAFGDINAFLAMLGYSDVRTLLVALDLTKTNFASELAEELGAAVADIYGGTRGPLRNLVNNFQYVDPTTLPDYADDDSQLTSECHSFSRVFSGAVYDVLVGIYNYEVSQGQPPAAALLTARNAVGRGLCAAIKAAPAVATYYNSVAMKMVVSMGVIKPAYSAIVSEKFAGRNIIGTTFKAMEAPSITKISDIAAATSLRRDVTTHDDGSQTVVLRKEEAITLAGSILMLTAGATGVNHYLSNTEINIPRDVCYEFDKNGNAIGEISQSREAAIKRAVHALQHLHNTKQLAGLYYDKAESKVPYKVVPAGSNFRLIRTKFIN